MAGIQKKVCKYMKAKYTFRRPFSFLSLGFYSEEKEDKFRKEYVSKSLNTLRLGLIAMALGIFAFDAYNASVRGFDNMARWIGTDCIFFLLFLLAALWSYYNSDFFALVIHPLIGNFLSA